MQRLYTAISNVRVTKKPEHTAVKETLMPDNVEKIGWSSNDDDDDDESLQAGSPTGTFKINPLLFEFPVVSHDDATLMGSSSD